jgi:hypothetical protein
MSGYHLSATMLDSFLLWERFDWLTTDDLVKRLTRQYDDTPALQRDVGTAAHWSLEPDSWATDGVYVCPRTGHRIDAESANAIKDTLPADRIAEQTRYLKIGGHTVACKVDYAYGVSITDFKFRVPRPTKSGRPLQSPSPFDADKFSTAYQWRAYLAAWRADEHVHEVIAAVDLGDGVYVLGERDTLRNYSYPGMFDDLRAVVTRVANFIDSQGLDVLPSKF